MNSTVLEIKNVKKSFKGGTVRKMRIYNAKPISKTILLRH
ncbi:UNVERIFIED_ORG: hypothetical protein ABIC97_004412 [Peribacillus simplex]